MTDARLIDPVLSAGPVIAVMVIEREDDAVPLARALVAGGMTVLEITLRTPAALEAIRRIASEVPEAITGAGTLYTAEQIAAAQKAGARFGVSPGSTPALRAAARSAGLPFLPGAATPSEIMTLAEEGYQRLKFFPAEAAGGARYLASLASPFAGIRFCPTGGITLANAPDYLKLANVACIGGSWMAPPQLMREGRWDEITRLARAASALAAAKV